MKDVNIIDGSNIFFITFSVCERELASEGKEVTEEEYPRIVSMFLRKLQMFLTSANNIVTFEGEHSISWRKEIYPEYKLNREDKKSLPGHAHIGRLFEIIEKDILPSMPCKIVYTKGCEGDDCIFALTERFVHDYPECKVTIVSSDEDLTQMCNFWPKNVQVLSPITRKIREVNPHIILYKTLVGDNSDNIKFKKGIGPAAFKKMLESRTVYKKYVATPEDEKRVESIHKIVDLRCFPLEKRQEVIKDFNKCTPDLEGLDKISSFIGEGQTYYMCKKCLTKCTMLRMNENFEDIKLSIPTEEFDTSDVWPDFGD